MKEASEGRWLKLPLRNDEDVMDAFDQVSQLRKISVEQSHMESSANRHILVYLKYLLNAF